MEKSQPPQYTQNQPDFTPASYYQPGQPQNPPMPQPQQPTIIIHQSVVPVGNAPTRLQCPSCQADILTSVEHKANTRTHCWAILLCLFICWPCACVPYCMDSCQSVHHTCPNCHAFIGKYDN